MKKLLALSEKITLSIFIISIAGFIYNFILYIRIEIMTINLGLLNTLTGKIEIYAGISVILIIIFHFSAILTIILKLKAIVRESIFLSFIFFISNYFPYNGLW